MATNWHSETIDSYLEALGSGAPTPGGGAAAGLTGAQACALAEMAASLTMSNQKYAALHEEAAHWKDLCRTGRSILLSLMDEDAKNFTALMEAVRLPKEFRFEGDEIIIKKVGNAVILLPKAYAYHDLKALLGEILRQRLADRTLVVDEQQMGHIGHGIDV